MQLKNRKIIITGGCSGLGNALVTAYLTEGAKVVAFDVNDQAGQELAHKHDSDELRYIHCNVASEQSVSAAVISVIAFLGDLDVVVNCASMSAEQLALHDEDMARRIPIGGRLGDAESDLAPVLVFLAGEGSRFVTGQTLAVDGGLMMVS